MNAGARDDAEGGDRDSIGDRDPVDFNSSTPPAEWALAGVGAALAVVMIGFLVVVAVRAPDAPPQLTGRVVAVTSGGEGYTVDAEIHNSGGAAARTIAVKGELVVDGEVVETATAQLDYLPGGASRRVGLLFEHDPALGEVDVAPEGFTE